MFSGCSRIPKEDRDNNWLLIYDDYPNESLFSLVICDILAEMFWMLIRKELLSVGVIAGRINSDQLSENMAKSQPNQWQCRWHRLAQKATGKP